MKTNREHAHYSEKDIFDFKDALIEANNATSTFKLESLKLKIDNYRRAINKAKISNPDDPRIPIHEDNLLRMEEKYKIDVYRNKEMYLNTRTKLRKSQNLKDVK